MSDPFRDDQDAAIARAEALQAELDRTKREKEELEGKLAEAADKAKKYDEVVLQESEAASKEEARIAAAKRAKNELKEKAKLDREQDDRDRARAKKAGLTVEQLADRKKVRLAFLITTPVAIALVVVMILPGYFKAKDHRAWVTTKTLRERELKEWKAMLGLHACLVTSEEHVTESLAVEAKGDPRRGDGNYYTLSSNQFETCSDEANILANDEDLPIEARALFTVWVNAIGKIHTPYQNLQDYMQHDDWKDDDYASGPAKWAVLRPTIETLRAAVGEARSRALPLVRKRMIDLVGVPSTMQETRLRVKLGFQIEDLGDLILQMKENRATREQVIAAAKRIIEATKDAPLEVRREMRSSDTIDTIANGGYMNMPSTYALWNAIDDDKAAPFPALGEEPSAGCDGDGDGAPI